MSRLMQRLRGRVYAWFDHDEPVRRQPRLRPMLLSLEDRVTPATFSVLNTNESGAGSLFQAITDANSTPNSGGADIITFDAAFNTTVSTIRLAAALPTITESVTITGPGADRLTLRATGTGYRAFTCATTGATLTLEGMTISNFTNTSSGGAISITQGGNLSLNFVTVSHNSSGTTAGGGLLLGGGTAATFNINNSTISNNTSGNTVGGEGGGGIRLSNTVATTVLNVTNSTITGNSATNSGGALNARSFVGTVTITNSTIVLNSAGTAATTAGHGGGGISRTIGANPATINLRNTILAENSAGNGTPDVSVLGNTVLNADYCLIGNGSTAAFNNPTNSLIGSTGSEQPAKLSALGWHAGYATPVQIPLASVPSAAIGVGTSTYNAFDQSGAGRTAPPDIGAFDIANASPFAMMTPVNANYTATGSYSLALNFYDNSAINFNTITAGSVSLLTPAGNTIPMTGVTLDVNANGPVRTGTFSFNIAYGSLTAADNGPLRVVLAANSVRNTNNVAIAGGVEGVLQMNIPFPTAAGTAGNISTTTTANTISVTYTDIAGGNGIKASTFDGKDILVTGPGGFSTLATFVNASPAGNTSPVTVNYSITGPGGSWDAAENGNTYSFSLVSGEVVTVNGIPYAAQPLGSFYVSFPTTYTVTNANDSGSGSLRAAITAANAFSASADTVVFDPTFFATSQTIALQSALPTISTDVTITGPGVAKLTLQRAGGVSAPFSMFTINNGQANAATVSVSGINVVGNAATAAAISSENVTFNSMRFSGVTLTGSGGAIGLVGGTLALNQSTITGNSVTGNGGGVFLAGTNSSLTVNQSSIENNTALGGGGIGVSFTASYTTLVLDNSTLSGNSATIGAFASGYPGGGGLLFQGSTGGAGLLIRGSTISGNSSNWNGGGLAFGGLAGALSILNSTITGNVAKTTNVNAGYGGGGVAVVNVPSAATLAVESSIVSGNSAANGKSDIATVLSNLTFDLNTSAVGVQQPGTGYATPTVNSKGNLTVAESSMASLNLGPLQLNYAGTTKTHDIPVGSSTIGKGSNPAALNQDQNGSARVQQGSIDIGSVEHTPGPPSAAGGNFPNVNTAGTSYSFTVTYADETALNAASLGNNDVIVTRTSGGTFSTFATFVSSVPSGQNTTPIVATYTFTAPGGTWDAADNGTYAVTVQSGAVLNTLGLGVPTTTVGGFTVNFATTYAVLNTNNSGAGSLRQAILDANANTGAADTIVFDATFFGSTARTITLTGGELAITDPLTITGPGMKLLTLSGNRTSRVFNIDTPRLTATTISDMALTLGSAAGDGGAVLVKDDTVTLSRVTITENRARGNGGGVAFQQGDEATLTISDSVLSFNTATVAFTSDGGGVWAGSPNIGSQANLVIAQSSILNNSAPDDGGGIAVGGDVSVLLAGSTVARNVAGYRSAQSDGAGVAFTGTVGPNGFTIRNSTIADNTCKGLKGADQVGAGGVGLNNITGLVQILNSTITGNSTSAANNNKSGYSAGGIGLTGANGSLALVSTIVSGNLSAGFTPDIASAVLVDADHSAIGDSTGFGLTTGSANNLAFGLDLKLGTLTGNGGGTATRGVLPGSPLINAGVNPAGLNTDQRGTGFLRSLDGGVDIGAFERKAGTPLAFPVANELPPITVAGGTVFTFTITYTSNDGLNISTINGDEIRITGPNGFVTFATVVSLGGTDPNTRTVTYSFTPPGGSWNFADNGRYIFELIAGSVATNVGGFVSGGAMFAMYAYCPLNFLVTTTADSGPGSLRQAVLDGNTNGSGATDIITFSPLFDSPQQINLTSGELPVMTGTTIQGPGANKLTISAGGLSRIFNLDDGAGGSSLYLLSGMTLSEGSTAGDGGAIQFADESLTLQEVHVTASKAAGNGGGVAASQPGATLTVTRSAVTSNSATTAGGSLGGGAFMIGGAPGGTAVITNSTFAKNVATSQGGAFAGTTPVPGFGITMTIDQSTITANSAGGAGGALRLGNSMTTATISNTIISGNTGAVAAPEITTASVVSSYSALGTSTGFTHFSGVGDLTIGSVLNLGLLGSNGGLTPVVPLQAGSPAIDAGGSSFEVTDQRGPGFARVTNALLDIGAFEVQPNVTGFTVNSGDPQRSRILQVEVTFDGPVSAATFQGLGGVQFVRTGVATQPTGSVGDIVQSGAITPGAGLVNVAQGAANSILLTFDNTPDVMFAPVPLSSMVEYTSLSDGYWQMKLANYVSPLNSLQLRRAYGDSTNTALGVVNTVDLTAFGNAFNQASFAFDFNNDGVVNSVDLTAFGNHFNSVL